MNNKQTQSAKIKRFQAAQPVFVLPVKNGRVVNTAPKNAIVRIPNQLINRGSK